MPVELPDSALAASRSDTGTKRSDVPKDIWTRPGGRIEFGRERFRLSWIPTAGSSANLDPLIESISWDDKDAVLTGEITFRDPGYTRVPDIGEGDEFVLTCIDGGAHGETGVVWRMRCTEPFRAFKGGVRTLQLANALYWLSRSVDDFRYVRGKLHKNGWTADQILKDIAVRYGIPTGTIVGASHRIKNLTMLNASPLDVIGAAYTREKRYTANLYLISCRFGRLNVTPLRRSRRLLELGPTLIDAGFRKVMQDEFATALTVRATGKLDKGKDKQGNPRTEARKIVVKVRSPGAIKRYGYVHNVYDATDADSEAEARTAGLRRLVEVAKTEKQLTLAHPGIPDIQRGDAIKAKLADAALNQVIYITDVRHTLTAGDYRMDLEVTFKDPWVDAEEERAEQKRQDAAARRGRTRRSETTKKKQPPKPSTQDKRSDVTPTTTTKKQIATTPGERLTQRGHP